MTRSRTSFPTRPLAMSLLATAIVVATANAQVFVDSTPKVVTGTAPVVAVTITNTSRANQAPATGDVLQATPTISDAEGDAVQTVTYRWLRGDVEVGTGETYTTTTDDTGQELRVEVTASTDDTNSAPSSGMGMATVSIANAAPVATNLRIDGTRAVGQTLEAKFDYTDAEGDEAGDHLYNWCRRGYTCQISTSSTYKLVDADYNREITFEVVPVAKTGTPQGNVVMSTFGLALIPGRAPVADQLSITGGTYVGGTLTANYRFTDPDGDSEGDTQIEWCWRNERCGIAYGKTMTSTDPDFGKEISVQITPKSATGNGPNTGATQTAHTGISLPRRYSKGMYIHGSGGYMSDPNPKRYTTGVISITDTRPMINPTLRINIFCAIPSAYSTAKYEIYLDTPHTNFVEVAEGECTRNQQLTREVAISQNGLAPNGNWNVDVYLHSQNGALRDTHVGATLSAELVY